MSQLSQMIISHQIWLQRLGTQTASLSVPFVNKMRAEVRDAVLKFGDDARTVKKLNKMLASLDGVLDDVTGDWKSTIEKSLREIADYENKWFIHTLEANTKPKTFITGPTAEELWSRIKFAPLALGNAPVGVMDLMSGWAQTERNRLVRGVQTGFVQGQTTRQIVSAVAGPGGLADISERNVMTVVRTAVSHVSNTARDSVYDSNSDIVSKYQWVSTLDSRTSTVCKSRDGQKYDVGRGPIPPAHPNCRSTTIPVIEDDFLDFLDEGATRASRGADGGRQVDASTTYYDFLKQQPAWFQDEALGPTRGAIFRNSGMTPEEFRQASVDGFGRPLTISELAANDKRVADYLAKSKAISKPSTVTNAERVAKADKEFINKSAPIKYESQEKKISPPKTDALISVPDYPEKLVPAPVPRKLTSEQIGAIEYYKGDGFYNDNRILRNPEDFTKSEVAQAKANAERINSAIDSSKTTKDHNFYRGVRSSELYDSAESLIGGEIYNRTVQSTTYAKGVAESYAGLIGGYSAEPGKSVLFKIKVPKGSSALNVANLTNINSSEKEILLKAGSRYRVLNVTNHGQYKEIEVEYVESDRKI